MRPFGLGATLHDAIALADSFGPGTRIGFGAEQAGAADVLAPAGPILAPDEAAAALRLGYPQYVFAFGNNDAAGIATKIAPVIDALCETSGTGFMAACLAAPWAGRTVYQGHLFEGGRLVGGLAREFGLNLDGSVGVVAHGVVAAGAVAIHRQCGALKEQGKRLVLIDAIDDDDCTAIAEALGSQALIGGGVWVSPQPQAQEPAAPEGPVAILSGALGRQTIMQIGAAREAMPVFDLDFTVQDTARQAIEWALPYLGKTSFIITSSAPADLVVAGAPAAAVMAGLARDLGASGVRRLIITGNDTAHAVLRALEVKRLKIGASFGPLRWLQSENLFICVKPGGIGGKSLFLSGFEPQIRLNAPAK